MFKTLARVLRSTQSRLILNKFQWHIKERKMSPRSYFSSENHEEPEFVAWHSDDEIDTDDFWYKDLEFTMPQIKNEELVPFHKKLIDEDMSSDQSQIEEFNTFLHNQHITLQGNFIEQLYSDFAHVKFSDSIIDVLNQLNLVRPTSIQSLCWPQSLAGHDIVGIAQTGSGKTLGFVAPLIEHILQNRQFEMSQSPRAIILCPTRELVMQCANVISKFRESCNIWYVCLYGGQSKRLQLAALKKQQDIAIATPGRLLDLMQSSAINVKNSSYLVLDEADRMLDMGFKPQIDAIVNEIRHDRQVSMWSATWPPSIQELANSIVAKDFVHIKVGTGELTPAATVRHSFKATKSIYMKKELLKKLLLNIRKKDMLSKTIVFVDTKLLCDVIDIYLRSEGFLNHLSLHGDKDHKHRIEIMKRFKTKQSHNILIATDIAARGLDVPEVKYVINFDMPLNAEEYIHRIGRSGRCGKKGFAISFVSTDNMQVSKFKDLMSNVKKLIENGGQKPPADIEKLLKIHEILPQKQLTKNKNLEFSSYFDFQKKWKIV